jgi:hypothetical protein
MLALWRFFGTDRIAFVVASTVTNTSRSYGRINDFTDDVVEGRIWGGIHYRLSTQEGKKLGERLLAGCSVPSSGSLTSRLTSASEGACREHGLLSTDRRSQ